MFSRGTTLLAAQNAAGLFAETGNGGTRLRLLSLLRDLAQGLPGDLQRTA